MATKTYHGSCHCKAVRYEVPFDLAKGSHRCNCSIRWKARAWFAIVQQEDLKLLSGAKDMGQYQWILKQDGAASDVSVLQSLRRPNLGCGGRG